MAQNRSWTRTLLLASAIPMVVLLAGTMVGCFVLSAPRHEGPVKENFDGKRFLNQEEIPRHGFGDFLRWTFSRDRGPWKGFPDAEPGPPPPERVGKGELRVTFVNHATTLVQMDGVNILTDPIWSERASPFSWVGPKRLRPPGIRFEDLPPIDVVVVSHNHYDHMDFATLERLAKVHAPRIFVGLGNATLLRKRGIDRVEELDWWQDFEHTADFRVTSVPAQHFSQRGLCDRDRTLWTGYVLSGEAGHVYFAGDTGFGPHFKQIGDRFGPLRLAILPIGAYRPRWFMAPVHISPDEAVFAHRALRASTSMAMHFGTFRLADDGEREPIEDLTMAIAAATGPEPRFWVLGFGEGREVPPADAPPPAAAGNEAFRD